DIDSIEIVVNYDVPPNEEDYVHRIGRTARAERKGEAFTLITPDDMRRFGNIEKLIERSVDKLELPSEVGPGPKYDPKYVGGRGGGGARGGRGGNGGRSHGGGGGGGRSGGNGGKGKSAGYKGGKSNYSKSNSNGGSGSNNESSNGSRNESNSSNSSGSSGGRRMRGSQNRR
ncbi:MAG TPA: ATP-dependent helicase, partial [Flavobacteriales bacterium]|nr:ATP-dependent helicase [Flavobacteriales bacterium]